MPNSSGAWSATYQVSHLSTAVFAVRPVEHSSSWVMWLITFCLLVLKHLLILRAFVFFSVALLGEDCPLPPHLQLRSSVIIHCDNGCVHCTPVIHWKNVVRGRVWKSIPVLSSYIYIYILIQVKHSKPERWMKCFAYPYRILASLGRNLFSLLDSTWQVPGWWLC